MAKAIGQMGLSRDDYLDSTPFEFQLTYDAWLEKINAETETQLVQRMFVARLQLFKTLCPPQGKMISITDLWQLPGEEKVLKEQRKKKASTRERFEYLKNKWN